MFLKECKKKFDVIVEGKENEGYVEWKRWIVEQVKEYDVIRLTNLCKRCEIKLKTCCKDDGFSVFAIFTHIVSCILIALPFVGGMVFSAFTTSSSVYQDALEESVMQEYVLIVQEAITKLSTGIISYIIIGACSSIVLLAIMSAIDARMVRENNKSKIFYEELIEILEECLSKLT